MSAQLQKNFHFQYFDEASDVGIEDESGERVRQRKRPGRKPNPPSLQQRRAQNRAAQKAFRARESERRQERERLWQTQQMELDRMRQRLAQVEFEANYLRGYVLLLSLSCLVERGSMPQVMADTRLFPVREGDVGMTPYSRNEKINELPAILQSILDNDSKQVLAYRHALVTALCKNVPTPTFISKQESQESDKTQQSQNQDPQHQHQHQHQHQQPQQPQPKQKQKQPEPQTSGLHDGSPLEPTATSVPEDLTVGFTANKPVYVTTSETPRLMTPDDLAHMPPIQALHILRLQLKGSSILGELYGLAYAPTALQRHIPHDARIDYIPAGYMRDRMILFQGLYDMDDCFELLSSKTVFVGGDCRNRLNWSAPPEFSDKYWFLSHEVIDPNDHCEYIPPEVEKLLLEGQRFRELELQKKRASEAGLRDLTGLTGLTGLSTTSASSPSPSSTVLPLTPSQQDPLG